MLRRLCVIALVMASAVVASEHHGQVTFNGLPVPGASVVATQDGHDWTAITDQTGGYRFPDLAEGELTIRVEMTGFAIVRRQTAASSELLELTLLGLDQATVATTTIMPPAVVNIAKPDTEEKESAPEAADGLLINGSSNNGAASPFAQMAAFGNSRNNGKSLYNGGIGIVGDNSALDARPFSLTGQDTPKASYNHLTGLVAFGGPIKIPRLVRNGPTVFVGYEWTRDRNATTQAGLVPSIGERNGIFSGGVIPKNRFAPQALALLSFYPLPNSSGSSYNYQAPLISAVHRDALQTRFNKNIGSRDQVYGRFALRSNRSDSTNLFGFLDTSDQLGINTSVNWEHRFGHYLFSDFGYQFSRLATHVTPYFKNRENVSGLAGISGNNQDPANWGPPTVVFSSGITSLTDAQSSFDRNETSGVTYSMVWNQNAHNVKWGGDFRRQEFNYLSQQNPRGQFTFTGSETGSDFGDFLLGAPNTSAVAFGNADKYFRGSVYDAFVNDDWRISSKLTLNTGVRWEYGAPITERYGRLVNLDIGPDFTSATAVVSNNPVKADRQGIDPRIGVALRPISGSSLVIRAGYGIYRDTSVYQTIALQMGQQSPLSKSLTLATSAANPITLANGLVGTPQTTSNTFAIDPSFRIGYAQNWQVTVQRDLPASLQMAATYLGIKGTHGTQDYLPNSYPIGGANSCVGCPVGFAYVSSGGNSTREAAQLQLRRRLHNGVTGLLQYTFSKSIDNDAALGGQGPVATSQNPDVQIATAPPTLSIAQNWRDLKAERGLSSFDQRHLLSFTVQYTTGMGLKGGALLTGWKGTLLKEWNLASEISAGSGLPETPIYLAATPGTGFTGAIRPDYTGNSLIAAPTGLFLNPASYAAAQPGRWGNAGRNSITGPAEFSLNASLGRTFRLSDRFNLDLRLDSTNALNRVNYTSWNTTINSPQFGSAAAANAMRNVQTTMRVRF